MFESSGDLGFMVYIPFIFLVLMLKQAKNKGFKNYYEDIIKSDKYKVKGKFESE